MDTLVAVFASNGRKLDAICGINGTKRQAVRVGHPFMRQIRIGVHQVPQVKVRVVLDLGQKVPYTIVKTGRQLRVTLSEQALALAAPRRAIAWHSEFHSKVDKEDRRLIPQPWMTIADVFGHEGLALHKRITEQVFHLWVIDKED